MNRYIRMRKYSNITKQFEILFPQAMTSNTLRYEDGGVLEQYLDSYDKHLSSNMTHFNHAVSSGTYRDLTVRIPDKVLVDGFPLLLKLHTDLECDPTLAFNDNSPIPIVSGNGEAISGGQTEGSILFLVYNELSKVWILMSNDTFSDVTKVVLPVENEYVYVSDHDNNRSIVIPKFNKRSDKITLNYNQTILRKDLDYTYDKIADNIIILNGFGLDMGDQLLCIITKYITTARKGRIQYDLISQDYTVDIKNDNTTEIILPAEAKNSHSILVNYNQTVLRNNLDYDFNDDKDRIILRDIVLSSGENITFTITSFSETNGEIVPNNWGATGNYRYSFNVVHTEYTSTENRVTVIPVPEFNPRRDDITVIRNNKLYIFDVDYTIDEVGQVVLLKDYLNVSDSIYFTILQGAMMDVPNFNIIDATGTSSQHLLVNMTYSVLSDYYALLVRLKYNLAANPTLKCIDGPAEPICDCYGGPITGGYAAGAYLWLVYNKQQHRWYSLSHGKIDVSTLVPTFLTDNGTANFLGTVILSQSDDTINDAPIRAEAVIPHKLGTAPTKIEVTPCEPPNYDINTGVMLQIGDVWSYADEKNLYVGNTGTATSKFRWCVSTEDQTNDLRSYIDKEITTIRNSPGNFITYQVAYTVPVDDTFIIEPIDNFNSEKDYLFANYNQTVLRKDIDFVYTENNGIELTTIRLAKDDIIQFTIIVQE